MDQRRYISQLGALAYLVLLYHQINSLDRANRHSVESEPLAACRRGEQGGLGE